MRDRLMALIHLLRNPQQKPPITEELDRRLDRAEQRLMTIENANRAQQVVRGHR